MRRETLTLIKQRPTAVVMRLEHETEEHFEKRSASIARLGRRWLRHPHYEFDPRHSSDPHVWKPAFAQWWADSVLPRAAADRARNEAFQRAQRVRAAISETP